MSNYSDLPSILFPSYPGKLSAVYPDYSQECEAARVAGFQVAFIDTDALAEGEKAIIRYPSRAMYRGWMLSPAEYEHMYKHLAENGCLLVTAPEQYEENHTYPGYEKYLRDVPHPRALWTTGRDIPSTGTLTDHFGIGPKMLFVKDWVKSAGDNKNASVIRDHTNADDVNAVCTELLKERGAMFNGGFVFKEYLELLLRDDNAQIYEARLFFWNEQLFFAANLPEEIEPIALQFASIVHEGFYTVDIIKAVSGWHVMEMGDGGVSDTKDALRVQDFYNNLREVISEQ